MQERDSGRNRTLDTIGALLGIAYLLWAMWTLMVPEPTRREWRLRITLSSARGMSRLGRHAAAASMAREVSTGQANYELPYWLMTASNRLMDAYGKMTL